MHAHELSRVCAVVRPTHPACTHSAGLPHGTERLQANYSVWRHGLQEWATCRMLRGLCAHGCVHVCMHSRAPVNVLECICVLASVQACAIVHVWVGVRLVLRHSACVCRYTTPMDVLLPKLRTMRSRMARAQWYHCAHVHVFRHVCIVMSV